MLTSVFVSIEPIRCTLIKERQTNSNTAQTMHRWSSNNHVMNEVRDYWTKRAADKSSKDKLLPES